MAKSKKKVTAKATPTVKRKPQPQKKPVVKAQPAKKSAPVPVKKSPVKQPAKKQQAVSDKSKAKPAEKNKKSKSATKQVKKGKSAVKNKKQQKSSKGKKGKEIPKKKGVASKVVAKPVKKYKGKKRGRKKKNKGSANYQKIKAFILKRHRRRTNVETDAQATLVAKALYKWLKINNKLRDGRKLTQKLILEALDELYPQSKRKLGRRTFPEIPDYLKEPKEFYNVEEVLDAMREGLFRRVWIFSPMILGKRSGAFIYLSPTVTYTYEETFKDWVDWINEMINDGSFPKDTPPLVWFKFRDVFWNTINRRFEVKMIPCDEEGNQFQIGYIPQGVTSLDGIEDDGVEERFGQALPDEPISPILEPELPQATPPIQAPPVSPTQQPPVAVPSGEAKEVTDEKVKTEKEKQKGVQLDNLIKVKNSIMEDLRFNKEMGLPIEQEAIKRLTEIRKQIDDLVGK